WVGSDNKIPTFLVNSVNLVYKKKVKIFHLTNYTTRKINGTTKTIRSNLSENLMVARLQAYKNFPYNSKLTFFCDADSLFVQRLNLFELPEDIYLIKRSENFLMNHNWPEFYPEFINKHSIEIMPYLFGGMALKDGKKFFSEILKICFDLPQRFHRWYGDQYALKVFIEKNKPKFNFLPANTHLKIVRQIVTEKDFNVLFEDKVKMITFKGPHTKNFINESSNNLINFYDINKFS
ncbi:hypothetical protein OAS37_01425, partial [Alphaproteobacteria bacterium]|nr:hypothetical protein [Alphaproteobacteria bacterium]